MFLKDLSCLKCRVTEGSAREEGRKGGKDEEGENSSLCSFTPHMIATARVGASRNQEPGAFSGFSV